MALSQADVRLIRASWLPAREDPTGAGLLLFKGLFTKFPDYLGFFSQFSDLDLEALQENARLIKHAVRVIDTITFVVDTIGEPSKEPLLNEALASLVCGHLKRRVGLREFRNLGVVLIDFLCEMNNRRAIRLTTGSQMAGSAGGGTNSSASSSQDSETMTSALDKIRASSSPSSSSEGDALGLLAGLPAPCGVDPLEELAERAREHPGEPSDEEEAAEPRRCPTVKLDAGLLVAAWTRLYGLILELVESEETRQSAH